METLLAKRHLNIFYILENPLKSSCHLSEILHPVVFFTVIETQLLKELSEHIVKQLQFIKVQ